MTAVESAINPFTQFSPLIKDVAEILNKVKDLYKTAQHNKKIAKVLMGRIFSANSIVNFLLAIDDSYILQNYISLHNIVQVLQNVKNFIEKITQYNTVRKFLRTETIEKKFKELCKEYDNSISSLNFTLMFDFKFNAQEEDKVLKEDIEELSNFQDALEEGMTINEEALVEGMTINGTDTKMDELVEKVSEMAITIQSFLDKKGGVNQDKIDNIFNESSLPFKDYEETSDEPRSERLRKYVRIKNRGEFAFKTVDRENINQVKNQVTILKKLQDYQNIIHFYGITYDGYNCYLVTEWSEKGNLREYISSHGRNIGIKLRIKFAYDIAKGLNFLNAVKIVHRNIMSKNIVITDHDVAKITNFKWSRGSDAVTGNIVVCKESVLYSAPEMLRRGIAGEIENKSENKTKYDTKCEVYSFGILLWEIAECKIPFEQFEDFMEVSRKVVSGYREPFMPGTAIPKKYQILVNKAVDQNPGQRPMLSKMLTELRDIFKNYTSKQPIISPDTIAVAENDCVFIPDWGSFSHLTVGEAVEEHSKNSTEKSKLYKCFDTYANLGNPKAKYWKAYYITKGWSDLTCSQDEKLKISVNLYKEAADYGDEYPDAQLRYATMVIQGKGIEQNVEEAIEYFLKAAKNGKVIAMYNVATSYFHKGNEELGKYYMIKAAGKKHGQAIKYCKTNNIKFISSN